MIFQEETTGYNLYTNTKPIFYFDEISTSSVM